MKQQTKPTPRSYLPMVTVRGNRYIPGGYRVTAKPGTKAAKLRLDYGKRHELIACHVPTQSSYWKARYYAEQNLLPAHCYEDDDEEGGEV